MALYSTRIEIQQMKLRVAGYKLRGFYCESILDSENSFIGIV